MLKNRQSFNNRPKYKYRQSIRLSSKQYSNPFFGKEHNRARINKSNFSIYQKLVVLAVLAAIIFIVWFFLYSHFFTITKIEINNEGRIPKENIEAVVKEQMAGNWLVFLPQKNIFLFSADALTNKIESKYSLSALTIKKKLPRTLIVNVTEKQYAAVWREDDKYYYVDDGGKVVSETNVLDVTGKDYPLIDNLSTKKLNNNQAAIEASDLKFIIDLYQQLNNYQSEFKVLSFIVNDEMYTVQANIENGPKIYFNTQRPADQQVEKLLLIKREQLKADFFKKQYINVRVQDRVYIR
jgi:cell division septal protein FtsQ